jgi:glycosyltransferase involved in cell wall biosynthesis
VARRVTSKSHFCLIELGAHLVPGAKRQSFLISRATSVTHSPRVSVILPVYNAGRYVRAAVQSILDQTFRDFELLAIDDGSTDDSLDILQEMAKEDARLLVHAAPHRGLVAALNRGLELARGTYIARMDADDIALPERFERQVAYLDRNSGCVVLGTGTQRIDAEGRPLRCTIRPVKPFDPLAFPPRLPQVPHPSVMMRAEAVRRIGGYRDALAWAQDRDLWARLATLGRIETLPNVGLQYRVHPSSVTRSRGAARYPTQIVVDLAAVARALGLDDGPILRELLATGDQQGAIRALVDLIGDRWPAKTYWFYYLIRHRSWQLLGFRSRLEMLRAVIRHVGEGAWHDGKRHLLAVAARRVFLAHVRLPVGGAT